MVVNDAGLLELARASAMLKHLNLSYSKKISDSGINHITQVLEHAPGCLEHHPYVIIT